MSMIILFKSSTVSVSAVSGDTKKIEKRDDLLQQGVRNVVENCFKLHRHR